MQVPAPFEYERATSVEHALELLQRLGPESRLLAGGHSLLPMMKLRLASPEYLIDIDGLAGELGYIREHAPSTGSPGGEVRIGAMTRHNALLESDLLARRLAIFTDAERVIADPVVRNRGTIGGALCQADPSEDLSAVCAAVGARMVIRGKRAERVVQMREFHRGPYRTAVAQEEMLTEVRVPLRQDFGCAYEKVGRRVGDWAVAAAGASVKLAGGTIEQAGIALAAVGGGVRSDEAEQALVGQPPSEELFTEAGRVAAMASAPASDQRGSADYKRHVAAVLTRRALTRATHGRLVRLRDAGTIRQFEGGLMPIVIGASTGWDVGLVLGVVVVLIAAAIVITIVVLASRIAEQARTAVAGVEKVREQTDELSEVGRINDSGVRILHSARALRKVAVGR